MAHDYAPHDFNHDLYSDILWRNSQGDVAVWSIRDNALVTGLFLERAPANEHIVSSGDLNGDLTSDIVWRNTDTGNIHYWLVNNTAITFRGDIYNPGTEWTAIDRGAAQIQYRCLSGHPVPARRWAAPHMGPYAGWPRRGDDRKLGQCG